MALLKFLLIIGFVSSLQLAASVRLGKKKPENTTMTDTTFKILVTHPEVPEEALDLLKRSCEVIVLQSVPPKRSEILEKIRGVHGLYWASHEPLNAQILDAAGPQLKSISTLSAGIDYVDLAEIKKRKIPLGHTPTVLNEAVADLAIGLMIAAARRFHEGRLAIDRLVV